jgi:hypothetical protein
MQERREGVAVGDGAVKVEEGEVHSLPCTPTFMSYFSPIFSGLPWASRERPDPPIRRKHVPPASHLESCNACLPEG